MSPKEPMSPKERDHALRAILRRWWYGLTDAANDGLNRRRGDLARLRRIDLVIGPTGRVPDVVAALAEEAFRDLCHAIDPVYSLHQAQSDRIEDLVTAAATLAQIREDVRGRTTAQLLGGPKDEDRLMKDGRLRNLMRAETSADLFDQARRLPDLLKGAAPVGELGASLLLWRSTPLVRRDWARDYYHLDLGGRERSGSETPTAAPASPGA